MLRAIFLQPFLLSFTLSDEPVEVPPVHIEAEAPSQQIGVRIMEESDIAAPAGPVSAAAVEPATQVRMSGGPGQAISLSLRGNESTSTLCTLDGVPLNSPFMGGADLFGLSLLPIESMSLTRGGLSAVHGSDAVGGLVEAKTPSPFAGPYTAASLMFGSFGTLRVKAERAETSSDMAGLVSIGLFKSSGDFPYQDSNGRSRVRTHAGALALDGLIKLEILTRARQRLTIMTEGFFDDRDVPGMEQFPSDTARQGDSRAVFSLSWNGPALWGDGESTARIYLRRIAFEYNDKKPPMGPPISTSMVAWGSGLDGQTKGSLGSSVDLITGVHAALDYGFVNRSFGSPYEAHRSFVAASVAIEAGRKIWPVWFALRLRAEYDPEFTGDLMGFRPIPRAEIYAKATDWLRFFGSLARAFRLPTFEELHFDSGFVKGNPDLEPEDAFAWDIGFELGPKEDPWLRAAYFETRLFNAILFLPRSAFVTRAENYGTATVRGMEASFGHKFEYLTIYGSYTFLDARSPNGLFMPHRPKHQATAEIRFEGRQVLFLTRARFQSAFFLDRFESLSEEWRLMLDARIEYAPIDELRIALEFDNLLDKRDAVDTLQQPLPGLGVFGSLRVFL